MKTKSIQELFVETKEEKGNLDAPTRDMKVEDNTNTNNPTNTKKNSLDNLIYVSSDEENGHHVPANHDNSQAYVVSKQLVPYDPKPNGSHENGSDEAAKQLVLYDPKPNGYNEVPVRNNAPRVLPDVGHYAVQCAKCFKWRFTPTKKKYESLRARQLHRPFLCEYAKEWRPDISCEDPADIERDKSRLWALDIPNIPQTPAGWDRELKIRAPGCSKFADVYYVAPNGKRLRSMVEIQTYLTEHPELVVQGTTLSQFSFRTPKPVQENYVRKRPSKRNASNMGTSRPLEREEVRPLSIAAANEDTVLRLTGPTHSNPGSPQPRQQFNGNPTKQPRTTPSESSAKMHDQMEMKMKMGHSPPAVNNVW